MTTEGGLIFACVLDGRGRGRFGGWELVRAWAPDDGVLWVHLDFRADDAQSWLVEESGLDAIASAALLARWRPPWRYASQPLDLSQSLTRLRLPVEGPKP